MIGRLWLCLLVGAGFFGAGWATRAQTDGYSHDGPAWRDVSTVCRLFYVSGFRTGYHLATLNAQLASLKAEAEFTDRLTVAVAKKQITPEVVDVLTAQRKPKSSRHNETWSDKLDWTGWLDAHESSGEIQEGMDKFYEVPANQGICWPTAFAIVAQSIAGQSFSETDMSAIRRNDTKTGCQ